MPQYRVNWLLASKTIRLESGTAEGAPPATIGGSYVDLGLFRHDNVGEVSNNLAGMQLLADNHTLYQHVQDLLYKRDPKVLDMHNVTIFVDRVRTLSIGAGTVTVAAGEDAPALTVTTVPTNGSKDVIFTTSDATKATVDADGIIHGVAEGSAVITGTLVADETITATRNVTVTA